MRTTIHSFYSVLIVILLSPILAFAQPTASNPLPVNVECIGNLPSPDPLVVTDEADIIAVPSVFWEEDVSDGQTCPETITRYYKVIGDGGNFIFVNQTITVNDVTNPTASNPTTINLPGGSLAPAPDVSVVINEADNCSSIPVVTFVSDVSDGLDPETITRTYCITDDCGNQNCVTQLLIISASVGIEEISSPTKELIKIVDLMGKETTPQKNSVYVYVYSDGSTKRIFEFE